MLKKISFLLFLIFFSIFVYFAYPIVKSRYFEKNNIQNQPEKTITNQNESEEPGNKTQESTDQAGTSPNISARDCDKECEEFKDDEKNLKYCQEVCGFSPEKVEVNCGDKSGLEKDYCFKSLAIQNKDFKICDQISDSGIKKACKNRISEDIIESQTSN